MTPNLLEPLWWRGKQAYTGQVWVSLGWFDHTEPPRTTVMQGKPAYRAVSSEFGVVQPHRTSVNQWKAGVQGMLRVVQPHRTSVNHWKAGLQGKFEWVRSGSSTPNLLEPLCCRRKQAYRAVSSEFFVVRPHRTSSNHYDEGGRRPTGQLRVS